MMGYKQYVYLLLGVLALSACKEDVVPTCDDEQVNPLKITVQPVFGGQNLDLDSTYFTAEGYGVQFTDIKFYMENLHNGNNVLAEAGLFNYRENGTFLLSGEGLPENFSSLNANLGVDASINHNDPVGFDPSSPLYISNANDMHWGWNPGYIFVKVEAKVDTIADATPLFDHNVVFHVGADVNMQTLSFTGLNWVNQGSEFVLPMRLDMQTFLQNGTSIIDLKDEYSTHTAPGQEVLSTKVMVNFKSALTLF